MSVCMCTEQSFKRDVLGAALMGPSVFWSRPRPYPLQLITLGENEREETLGHARPGSQKAQQG